MSSKSICKVQCKAVSEGPAAAQLCLQRLTHTVYARTSAASIKRPPLRHMTQTAWQLLHTVSDMCAVWCTSVQAGLLSICTAWQPTY